jgi:hypothetical protein
MPYPDSEYPSVLRGRDKRESQRLMAAAPEMLECLRRTVSLLKYASTDGGIRGCNADEWWAMEPRCDAVIATAEGRSDA